MPSGKSIEFVRVIYHREADGWWAESPDLKGWSAAGDSYTKARRLATDGVRFVRQAEASRPGSSRLMTT